MIHSKKISPHQSKETVVDPEEIKLGLKRLEWQRQESK